MPASTGLELKGGGFSFNYSNLLIQAAVDGLGVALGNTMLASDDLRAGRLVKPFDISVPLDTGYYVVYVRDALKRPKIRAFRDWVIDQVAPFRAEMSPEGDASARSSVARRFSKPAANSARSRTHRHDTRRPIMHEFGKGKLETATEH